ncbi:MAG TPA: hypothetical protein VG889_13025 [Rhizomicrobium sp.]|nr:hypothetical protein [Rhizomicrobium sp.]
MAKAKLLEDIKSDPARFYPAPSDVVRDRRFSDAERLEILEAWEREARALAVADEEGVTGGEPSRLKTVVKARMEVQERVAGAPKYPETGKFGGGATG